jgi:hypothetical protein
MVITRFLVVGVDHVVSFVCGCWSLSGCATSRLQPDRRKVFVRVGCFLVILQHKRKAKKRRLERVSLVWWVTIRAKRKRTAKQAKKGQKKSGYNYAATAL